MQGVIKKMEKDRGFGFITSDDGKDFFFHLSACRSPRFDDLNLRDRVNFKPTQGPRGPRAEEIVREE